MALKRWVMRRAPRRTASVAKSVVAMLAMYSENERRLGGRDSTHLCPMENTIPRWSNSGSASSTPVISGAPVMMRTPTGASLSMSQSSLVARFCSPYTSSNEAKPFGEERICRGACAPLFAGCIKGPSACHPRSVAPLGWAQGRRSESKVG